MAIGSGLGGCWAPSPWRPPRRAAIVSLGDSFISGEGGRWLGNGSEPSGPGRGLIGPRSVAAGWVCEYDPARVYGSSAANDCHRSDVAPIRSAPVAVAEKVNLACSGARVANVLAASAGGQGHFGEPPQADQLAVLARRADVRMVVAHGRRQRRRLRRAGGRVRAGLGAQLRGRPGPLPRRGSGGHRGGTAARCERGLARALRGIRAAMAAAGYRRSDYRLVTMGYASPFPPVVGSATPRRAGAGSPRAAARSGTPTPTGLPASAIGSIDARDAVARRPWSGRRVPRPPPRPRRPPGLRQALAPSGLGGTVARDLRVGPAARLRPGLRAANRSTPMPTASARSAPASASSTRALRGDYGCQATPGRSYVGGMRIEPPR